MADLSLYFNIIKTCEHLNVPYVIIGAYAAAVFGSTRVTYDIDIVVDLDEHHIKAIAERFPLPRYYADSDQMRDSIRLGIMFNIIDTERGQKVDLVPLTMEPRYKNALKNRQRQTFEDAEGNTFQAWCAPPEDIIFGKLMAWKEGQSYKHERDIIDMLAFIYSGVESELSEKFNEVYIDKIALALGNETLEFWNNLKRIARKHLGID